MTVSFDRRGFMKTATGALVALPLMQAGRAFGQATTAPKRLVVFYTPNGVIPSAWFPAAGSTETQFSLGRMMTPLTPHQADLIVTRGINLRSAEVGPGEPHQKGMGAVLTGTHLQQGSFVGGDGSRAGWGNGKSIDQTVADVVGVTRHKKSLELGVRVNGAAVRHRISYAGPGNPLPPIQDPRETYAQLFADFTVPGAELEAKRRRRKSVLDGVLRQFRTVRTQVSAEDRAKLDAHYTMVRDIERRLDAGGALQCTMPAAPSFTGDANNGLHMDTVTDLQIDMLVAALACDQTRVATLQMSSGANNIRFNHLDGGQNAQISNSDDHSLSHAGPSSTNAQEAWIVRKQWYSSKFARLLAGLKAIPEDGGTVLDNTVILWASDIAVGQTHSQDNMPFVLAGGAGGWQTGRYVDFGGASHNDLLVSLGQAMGLPLTTFGDANYCTGPLSGL